MRRTIVAAAAVLAGAACALVAASDTPRATAANEPAPTTAPVERGPLNASVAVDGTLTYRARADGRPYAAINQAKGTYTALPAVGDEVRCGDALYRVDDEPVLLLCGWIPAYRDLALGDEGRDVRQLNRNLKLAGREFTSATAQALRRLQKVKGLEPTGALDRHDAVFLPRPVRIAKVTGRLGAAARPGAEVVRATSASLEVQLRLAAAQQGQVRAGDRALVTLPGNRTAKGRVARLGRVAETANEDDDAAAATIPAFVRLDRPGQVRGLDRAPVQVEITTRGVRDALSVPVTALVGKAGGGSAVEVVRRSKRTLVEVELGLVDTTTGRVEITGELAAGDDVVVPAP